MRFFRLTALGSLILSGALFLSSCEKDAEEKTTVLYEKKEIVLTGAQEVPAVNSPGLGKMDVSYSKLTKLLSYRVSWAGLADSVSAMHIHGLAPVGFNAGITQHIISGTGTTTGTNGAQFSAQTAAGARLRFTRSSTTDIVGTLLVDGNVVKEEDLINGLYYMNIHTKAFPGGEVRGQIRFQ